MADATPSQSKDASPQGTIADEAVVTLSLVAHTNVGKTTLARTLLRRDVGEVLDQAHVTTTTVRYDLLLADGSRLVLEDTPGFGDSPRLLKRLQSEGNPIGWFLHQVWDRLREKPLWCAQEAMRSVSERADVVLYLVNAAESPQDAGYVAPEMEILAWSGRPVLVLLNQTGPDAGPALCDAWRAALADRPFVKGVLSLDAFTRCWVEERALVARMTALVAQEKRAAAASLLAAWDARAAADLSRCVEAIVTDLASAAAERAPLPTNPTKADRGKAMDLLVERRVESTGRLVAALLGAHGIDGKSDPQPAESPEDFHFGARWTPDVKTSAIWGGLASGAFAGLLADLHTGGLSFGGGAVIGAIVGALGSAGLAKGYRLAKSGGAPVVTWSPDTLVRFAREDVSLYATIARFGRGRGGFTAADASATVAAKINETLSPLERPLRAALSSATAAGPDAAALTRARADVTRFLDEWIRSLLHALYPECASWLR